MKFDCIVMNPPYDRNLHLKILAEAIKHLKDENSVCVNLSPVRWLQDPLAKYKKNSDYHRFEALKKKIFSIDAIDATEASYIFNGGIPDIAIYIAKLNDQDFNFDKYCSNSIVDKVFSKTNGSEEFENNKKDGWRVKISPIYGGGTAGNHGASNGDMTGKAELRNIGKMIVFFDGMKNGKYWHQYYAHNGSTKIQAEIPWSLKFNSEIEATNFCEQYNTKFAKVLTHLVKRGVHVSPMQILWMGNSVNPRTGKLGYESEWTDADFYQFFDITPEEQKIIEETMEKYK